ncbi:MAG: helix-turn-helix domain-containing protein [Polyangiales bacterium]
MRALSPKDLAEALGVSESSLKRWVDAGKIAAIRTEGGHRRISLTEAVRFIRETGAVVVHPEMLGMPEIARAGPERLFHHLRGGDALGARGWLLGRYLAGASVEELCDGPVREAMQTLGELWRHDEAGIFIEHRATDICLQALAQLRNMFTLLAEAPIALGATPEDDPYLLPTFMAAIVMASCGLRTVNLGPDTPVSAMAAAAQEHQPGLVWISVSAPLPAARSKAIADWLLSLPATTTTVVGGRHSETIAAHGVHRVETMTELATLARGVSS